MGSIERKVIVGAAVGFFIGLFVGWMVLGWVIFPVKWIDTDPFDLKVEHKETYIVMVADSYALNGDLDLAKARLRGFEEEELARIIAGLAAEQQGSGMALEARRLRKLAEALSLRAAEVSPPPTLRREAPSLTLRPQAIAGVSVVTLLIIAGSAILWFGRGKMITAKRGEPEEAQQQREVKLPLKRFFTTYSLGDNDYDASFNIEGPRGEVIGGYGIGISETIGEGKPKGVAAFEVWLCDKNIARTVAKVLMSEHAYQDDALRAKLALRGETVLAEKGKVIALETEALGIRAEVMDLAYGSEPPIEGYFTRLAVELALTKREVSSTESTSRKRSKTQTRS